jgi:acetyl esterase/lipase
VRVHPFRRALPVAARLTGTKRRMGDAGAMRRHIDGLHVRPRSSAPPRGLARLVDIAVTVSAPGWQIYTVRRRGDREHASGGLGAVYLHGGSYINEINLLHWHLVAHLARSTGAEITVPIYPLAPRATAAVVVPAAAEIVAGLLDDVGSEHAVLIGDSAGGGLALAAVTALRDQAVAVPRDTILLSPWLDLSLSDPAVAMVARIDPVLAVEGLRIAGAAYRGTLKADDPTVSPINGDLSGLGRLTVFTGTRDLLNVDARRLRERIDAGVFGTRIRFHEADAMIHDYALLPIAEGRQARAVMRDTLRG